MKITHAPRLSSLLLAATVAAAAPQAVADEEYWTSDGTFEYTFTIVEPDSTGEEPGLPTLTLTEIRPTSDYLAQLKQEEMWYMDIDLTDGITIWSTTTPVGYGTTLPITAIGSRVLEGMASDICWYDSGALKGLSVSITLPGTIVRLEDEAFYPNISGCEGWGSAFVYFDPSSPPSLAYIGDQALYGTISILPDLSTVEYIGYYAFGSMDFGLGYLGIDADASGLYCTNGWVLGYYYSEGTGSDESRRRLDLSAASRIAAGAFGNSGDADKIQSVILPSSLPIIPYEAFYGCTSLGTASDHAIEIPASVTNIEQWAFVACVNLTNFVFAGNAPDVGPDAFYNVGTAVLASGEVPVATVQRGTTGWGDVPGMWNGLRTVYAVETPPAPPAPVVVDLSTLTGDYTATNGVILTNSTTHVVTIPAGATVTINGVTVAGGAGSGATGPATFADGGEAITTRIAPGANGTWMLTAFAELASGSADGLDDAQVKVYAANSLAGLASAQPMASGVVVTNKAPAVKVELEVTPPANADAQFFRVGFGE